MTFVITRTSKVSKTKQYLCGFVGETQRTTSWGENCNNALKFDNIDIANIVLRHIWSLSYLGGTFQIEKEKDQQNNVYVVQGEFADGFKYLCYGPDDSYAMKGYGWTDSQDQADVYVGKIAAYRAMRDMISLCVSENSEPPDMKIIEHTEPEEM